MQLVATDILADAVSLSLGLTALTFLVGLVLWLFGWWSHRFWAVLGTTVCAGVFGLARADTLQAHPLAAAVLLALAGGMLALALLRVAAFLAAGLTALLVAQECFPQTNQPVVAFLVGGLLCLFLFRPCLMALTSFAGAVLMAYAGLMGLHAHGLMDAVAWSDPGTPLVNAGCGLLALFGLAFQFFLHRRSALRQKAQEQAKDRKDRYLAGWRWPWGGDKSSRRTA